MKHISKMNNKEQWEFYNCIMDTAIEYARSHNYSGLSQVDGFDFYSALQKAIFGEFKKAKLKK